MLKKKIKKIIMCKIIYLNISIYSICLSLIDNCIVCNCM